MDDFLSLEGIFPKKRKSVVFLPNSKDENNLVALYITNDEDDEKKAICWKNYSQPTRGGTFYRKPELQKEQLLTDLVKCVYVTAKILKIVNEANFLPGQVCPHALSKHLKKLQDANMHTNGTRFVNKTVKHNLIFLRLLKQVMHSSIYLAIPAVITLITITRVRLWKAKASLL